VNEFLSEFSDDRRQDIGWRQLVYGLGERDEDESHLKLVVGEVFDDVGVEP